jgi:inosose dehydratase
LLDRRNMSITERIAGAPISWGVCEVPGWGPMLGVERVLREMQSLGLNATELGAPGFLPDDPTLVKATLDRFGFSLVGAFVPLVLHDAAEEASMVGEARRWAELLSTAGGELMISAAVMDLDWATPRQLSPEEWIQFFRGLSLVDRIAEDHGLGHVLHPHVGTVVERAEDVQRVLDGCDVRFCLDTGHLAIGGYDPAEFVSAAAGRVGHVHLKDVRLSLVSQLHSGQISLLEATEAGLFQPLGQGDVDVAEAIRLLEADGYGGWYVLEQDTSIQGGEPEEGSGPIDDVRKSIEFLKGLELAGAVA